MSAFGQRYFRFEFLIVREIDSHILQRGWKMSTES